MIEMLQVSKTSWNVTFVAQDHHYHHYHSLNNDNQSNQIVFDLLLIKIPKTEQLKNLSTRIFDGIEKAIIKE